MRETNHGKTNRGVKPPVLNSSGLTSPGAGQSWLVSPPQGQVVLAGLELLGQVLCGAGEAYRRLRWVLVLMIILVVVVRVPMPELVALSEMPPVPLPDWVHQLLP